MDYGKKKWNFFFLEWLILFATKQMSEKGEENNYSIDRTSEQMNDLSKW